LAPGEWPLIVEGKPAPPKAEGPPMVGKARRRTRSVAAPVASAPVTLRLARASVKGVVVAAIVEQGKSAKVVCELDASAPLPGAFEAALEGLPARVKAKPVAVVGAARKVEFDLEVAPTSPVGTHATLVCVLTGTVAGQKVVYRVGRNGTLAIA